MIFKLIEDMVKLGFIVATFYYALSTFVRKKQPELTEAVEKKRLVILFGLVLVVLAIKISEDVLGGESGPFDQAVLLFIHSHIPASLTPFFFCSHNNRIIKIPVSLYCRRNHIATFGQTTSRGSSFGSLTDQRSTVYNHN